MAHLTEDVLEAGREHLRAGDLEAFIAWADQVPILIDLAEVRKSFGRVLLAGDTARALRLFEAVWPVTDVHDAWVTLRRATLVAALALLVVLGLLGGVIYFFRAIS